MTLQADLLRGVASDSARHAITITTGGEQCRVPE